MRAFAIAFVLVLAFIPATPGASATTVTCSGTGSGVSTPYSVAVGTETADGYYAWPATAGNTLVMVGHGYGGKASSLGSTLVSLAGAGAVAVAMDFRGASNVYKPFTGAEDTAAAIRDLQAQCPGLTKVVLWGMSMGGHVSMLTVMQNPGLVDYLVDDVGPTNIPELLATLVPGGVVWGATYGYSEANQPLAPDPCREPTAVDSTNTCTGGVTLLQAGLAAYQAQPEKLITTSPALNVEAWTGAGLKRAYLLYQAGDSIVPPDHGLQLQKVLAAKGVPVTYYAVPFRGSMHVPDPEDPALYPTGIQGLGLPDHQSAGRELTIRIIKNQLSATAPAVVSGVYTPDAGDVLPYSTVRTGTLLDAPLAPVYTQTDPHVHATQGLVGKFTPGP